MPHDQRRDGEVSGGGGGGGGGYPPYADDTDTYDTGPYGNRAPNSVRRIPETTRILHNIPFGDVQRYVLERLDAWHDTPDNVPFICVGGSGCVNNTRGHIICGTCGKLQSEAWLCSVRKMLTSKDRSTCRNSISGGCPGTRAEGRTPTPAEATDLGRSVVAARASALGPARGGGKGFGKGSGKGFGKARDAHYGGRRVRWGRSQPSTAAHNAPHGGGEERSAADGPGGRSVVVNGERFYARGAGPGEETSAGAAHGMPSDTPRQHERPGEARSGGEATTGGGLSLVIGGVTIRAHTVEISGVAIYARGEAPSEAGRGGAAGEAVASDGATGGPEGAITAHGEPSGSQRQHGSPGEAPGAHGVGSSAAPPEGEGAPNVAVASALSGTASRPAVVVAPGGRAAGSSWQATEKKAQRDSARHAAQRRTAAKT